MADDDGAVQTFMPYTGSPVMASANLRILSAAQSTAAAHGSSEHTVPSNAMLKAWARRSGRIEAWQIELFNKYNMWDLESCTKEIERLCEAHQAKSRSYKVMKFLKPVLSVTKMYSSFFNQMNTASPLQIAPIVGGIMCALQITSNYLDYQERIAEMISTMGKRAPLLLEYEQEIYSSDNNVQEALAEVYGDIIDFSISCMKLILNKKGEISRAHSLKLWSLSLLNNFDGVLGPIVDMFKSHMEDFEKCALFCDRRLLQETAELQRQNERTQQQNTAILSSLTRSINQGIQNVQQSVQIWLRLNQKKLEREQKQIKWEQKVQDDKEQRRKRDKISIFLPSTNWVNAHREQCRFHLEGTGQWLIARQNYTSWKSSANSNLLWVNGKPGCGKSVLAALSIMDLSSPRDEEVSILYAYCKAINQTWSALEISCTLLKQLCQQLDDVSYVYDKLSDNFSTNQLPSWQIIFEILASAIRRFDKVFIVLDGLDECDDNEELAESLLNLVNDSTNLVKVLIFSRPTIITLSKASNELNSIHVDKKANEADIAAYITKYVSRDTLELDEAKDKFFEDVRQEVLMKADGMFLWVRLVLNTLKEQVTEDDVLDTVRAFPSKLNEVYDMCLKRIWQSPGGRASKAMKAILWVTNAKSPLTPQAVTEAIAMNETKRTFDSARMSANKLIEICADLVREDGNGYLVTTHTSFQEFLASNPQDPSEAFQAFQKLQKNASKIMAETCLSYILLKASDSELPPNSAKMDEFRQARPFLNYATLCWAKHAVEAADNSPHDLISQVMNSTTARELSIEVVLVASGDDFINLSGTTAPLHFLSLYGMSSEAQLHPEAFSAGLKADKSGRIPLDYALSTRSRAMTMCLLEQPNSDKMVKFNFLGKLSPLHGAAASDWPEVIEKLLSLGADKELQSSDSCTPLMRAVMSGSDQCIATLVDAGANLNCMNDDKDSALIFSIFSEQFAIAKLLIHKHADVNHHGKGGETALHVACEINNSELAELLLQNGADPTAEATEYDKESPIHYAASKGARDSMKLLLKAKPDLVNSPTATGFTPLHYAAFYGFPEITKLLLEHDASVDIFSPTGGSALHQAAKSGNTDIISLLIDKKSDINGTNRDKDSPLHFAVQDGHLAAAKLLIERGAQVNLLSVYDHPPLLDAIDIGETEIAKLLLDNKADPTLVGRLDSTALHYAAFYGLVDLIEPCLRNGADATATNKSGSTPLHYACMGGKFDFVKELLRLRPELDVNVLDNSGNNPLLKAADNGDDDTVRLLLAKGARSCANSDENRPIHRAAVGGHDAVVSQLIEHDKKDVLTHGYMGRTALYFAAMMGHLNSAKLLLSNDSAIDAKDQLGQSPIMGALRSGRMEVCEWLLENGADFKTMDENEETLLHAATINGYKQIVSRLLDKGCDGLALNSNGRTPFWYAAASNSTMILNMFLDREINGCNLRDRQGMTCFHEACQRCDTDILITLMAAGADPFLVEESTGHSAMHFAACEGRVENFEVLMKNDVPVDLKDRTNLTPTGLAAAEAYPDMVACFLRTGSIDLNSADSLTGKTPLIYAVESRGAHCVSKLLEAGAKASIRDIFGRSPLDIAQGHGSMMKLLKIYDPTVEVMPLERRREEYIWPAVRKFSQGVLELKDVSTLQSQSMRRELLTWLGQGLIALIDETCDQVAHLVLGEVYFPSETGPFRWAGSCSICSAPVGEEFFVCRICNMLWLCQSCHDDYKSGARGPNSIPKALQELQALEKTVFPAIRPTQNAFRFNAVLALCAFFNYSITKIWLKKIVKSYEEWKAKYKNNGSALRYPRPGFEFVQLMEKSGHIYEALLGEGREFSAKVKDDIATLEKDAEELRKKFPPGKEFQSFTCEGHEYFRISKKKWTEVTSQGDLLTGDGILKNEELEQLVDYINSHITGEKSSIQSPTLSEKFSELLRIDTREAGSNGQETELDAEDETMMSALEEQFSPIEVGERQGLSSQPTRFERTRTLEEDSDSVDTEQPRLPRALTLPPISDVQTLKRAKTVPIPVPLQRVQVPRVNSLPLNQFLMAQRVTPQGFAQSLSFLPESNVEPVISESPVANSDDGDAIELISAALESIFTLPRNLEVELTDESEIDPEYRKEKTWYTLDSDSEVGLADIESLKAVTVKYNVADTMDLVIITGLIIADAIEPGFPVEYFRSRHLRRLGAVVNEALVENFIDT